MVAYQKEPIPSPSHVAVDIPIIRNCYLHVRRTAVTGDIIYRDFATLVQYRRHYTDRRLDLMGAGSNPVHIRQRCDQPDSSMSAHAEVADIIKKDDAGGAFRVGRFAEQSTDDHVGSSWLIHD